MGLSRSESALVDFVASCYADPLKFVLSGYPWGLPGPLEHHDGPDIWQREVLSWLGAEVQARQFDGVTPVKPIRLAVSSGHGTGKSSLVAMIADWIMSTRPRARGTITADTYVQLRDKTWATLQRWTRMCVTGHWFMVTSERMYRPGHKDSWFCAMQSCREENSEAFAGQHAADSTSFYLFDESSGISNKIHEVAEGGLTDGEPMICLFGNLTRNTGAFHEACFGSHRARWSPRIIDSRTSKFTNKEQIQEWVDDYGEDSDFVRVRVRGLPPRASQLQFIDLERIAAAQRRQEVTTFKDDALVAGVDVSGGGESWNVVRFRRGMDGRTIPPIRIPGEATRHDRSAFLAILAGLLKASGPRKIAMMFVDSAFGAPYVERLQAMGFDNVAEVNFGATHPPDEHYLNMRAYMWGQLKDWLLSGAIPADDPQLEADLGAPGYYLDRGNRFVLESKEKMKARGAADPHDGDALALTFAGPVMAARPSVTDYRPEHPRPWMA